ncbi:thiamine phosphate synthase [Corticibacter populi]|uniref:Thiamine-phosphate synthase n=1 Tax=Corticibacter populi TaxID=1550736 RepID=A0A3M6R0E6_9BURK|nr:thiamine phosphate synthase [Corticibacter populi]RMX08718.1 thiamine phosphate synthase [Corticibacter populi]RZS36067.1 thiamine-phosphate diphosphorylase [Corticibacter populi]
MNKRTFDLSIYLVTDSGQCEKAGRSLAQTVQQAIAGGATIVQVREKDASARDFLAAVQAAAAVVPPHVTLLVNDRVDVYLAARAAGAKVDGVHIGQSELPAQLVRQLVGPAAIIGQSAGTPATLEAAGHSGVIDYVGIGPLHATTSKKNAPAPIGLAALARLRRHTRLPAVAIGGVTAADLAGLRAAGFDGAAVVSAICAAADAKAAARTLAEAWRAGIPDAPGTSLDTPAH